MVAIDIPLSHKAQCWGKPMSAVGIKGFSTGCHRGATWVVIVTTLLLYYSKPVGDTKEIWYSCATTTFDGSKM